jgi:undecaprenyl-diphosphatase
MKKPSILTRVIEAVIAPNMNIQLFQWIHEGAGTSPVTDVLAVFFGEGGPYILMVLFAVLWFLVGKNKKTVLLGATEAAILGLTINQLIGLIYFHPRPYMVGLCTPLFPHGPETSFPSDHATLMFAAAFYLLQARRWPACGVVVLMGAAVLTAWARVYSGVHFPFDMAGSLVVGLMSAALMRVLSKLLNPLNERLIQIGDLLTSRMVQTKRR